MAYLSLDFPPGLYRNGTERQSKGRWRDGNLVRFYEGTIRPLGGWRAKTDTTLVGKGRAIITWKDNSSVAWVGVGTEQKLYVVTRSGALYDITPAGYVAGFADASSSPGYGGGAFGTNVYGKYSGSSQVLARGYGGGNYGAGAYNTMPPDAASIQDATVWSLENWGEHLLGVADADGRIYEWTLNTGVPAAAVANAPAARAIVVTDQRILMALGAGGNPRTVAWSDQENDTLWTPDDTNQAGSFNLQTAGKLMRGLRFHGTVVLLTDLDAHVATYTGDVFVYSFAKAGDACGAVSMNCAAALDSFVVWMGKDAFYSYNGYVQKLACEVSDYVFSDINPVQASKVSCFVNSAFSEVSWFYPSSDSTEIDRYVTWNYRENHWSIGALVRLAGADRGAVLYPLLVGSDGFVYEHEVGFDYSGAGSPYVESGPFELGYISPYVGFPPYPGYGDLVMHARQLIPDEKTAGDVTASFKTRFYPNGPESIFGPYTLSSPTDVRFCGRQARLRYDGAKGDDWRVGIPRLEVVTGGKR